jgi:hypothetical protein
MLPRPLHAVTRLFANACWLVGLGPFCANNVVAACRLPPSVWWRDNWGTCRVDLQECVSEVNGSPAARVLSDHHHLLSLATGSCASHQRLGRRCDGGCRQYSWPEPRMDLSLKMRGSSSNPWQYANCLHGGPLEPLGESSWNPLSLYPFEVGNICNRYNQVIVIGFLFIPPFLN